ncbi:alpha-L-fucosidase [Neorhodopirellula lusitana]|uniref:alpha-L-fucosidase n=1 Tax=Neorhodopirellula lusitana TaxID=445327 RepID=UPI0038504156
MMNVRNLFLVRVTQCMVTLIVAGAVTASSAQEMDELWGSRVVKMRADNAERGQLFDEGNYAMFIHWGLYSQLGNRVNGKTYYGIGEWIMNRRMANIPVDQYKELAGTFNPVNFDAKEIVQLAKDAGMKYIVITSKHHDGFAMYHSKACDFNIVDSTPWKTDPMKELSAACQEAGLGFGFYYSHNQDWSFPGGGGGPRVNADGTPATFDDYFVNKCLPQVEEITTEYGPIEIVWFDTPGKMPKEYVEKLVEVVHKNQPGALVSGRAGHNLGDYQTLGDMEVPLSNVDGMWESVDTTNDSWAYAWYDEYWKSPQEILRRLVACVGRGGTYMLNIGPRGDGAVPERAARSLREAGEWIRRYPQVVYGTDASPWQHSLPWGDVVSKGNQLFLTVMEWPTSGELYLPGLKSTVGSAQLLSGDERTPLEHETRNGWTVIKVPARAPEKLASVIEVNLNGQPDVDPSFAVDPNLGVEIHAEFASVAQASKSEKRWMEKFGEWKGTVHVHDWKAEGRASFEVEVLEPGDYNVSLSYAGEGRLVWGVTIEDGEHIQNQQNSSHNYQEFPIGWMNFPEPGKYTLNVSCLEGNLDSASLKTIRIEPIH